ncbi:fumarylacetoacetate hydrolase family protein [Microbacterium sp. ZW T2_14]|uniref:fumarylacetoacetate hydrolase family protein n=1 Tax=Microbacterium sp. ZW T2_14 TaxID=3378079 RepID=UPI0038529142
MTDAASPGTPESPADPRFAALPGRPGKIVAVHLSYASRADQRGRRPEHPSYFLKPSSSVAASGSTIERPAGTELLAFEGEIALVIGAAARRVSLADAWDHVAWVTAADDFGLYDLRANDKGSNVRSKGGDGFTPLGPALIDARAVHPDSLRVRTWLNGELVQDDTSAGMIFPLSQLVADLSQHFTLEPGDVILTGTPAGSSVAQPGDVVEVEVDVPGGPSSGRLVTTVVPGELSFDRDLGSLPAVDDLQRTEAWGSREAAGLPDAEPAEPNPVAAANPVAEPVEASDGPPTGSGTDADATIAPLSPALRAKLEAVPVAGLSAQLRKRGLNNVHIDGVRPLHPESLPGTAKLVGTARTLRFVPNREDLFASHGGGYNAQKRVFDAVGEGEVVVIEARGEAGSGTLGDILAIRAHAQGAAGIVTDGGVRDAAAVAAVGIPVYSSGAHPAVLGRRHVPWDADLTIACGGTTVQPGDVIVGDADGVVVIPPAIVEEIVDAALAQEDEDAWIAERVAEGHPVDGLFPMNAAWRARFEAEHAASAADSGERGAPQTQRSQETAALEGGELAR